MLHGWAGGRFVCCHLMRISITVSLMLLSFLMGYNKSVILIWSRHAKRSCIGLPGLVAGDFKFQSNGRNKINVGLFWLLGCVGLEFDCWSKRHNRIYTKVLIFSPVLLYSISHFSVRLKDFCAWFYFLKLSRGHLRCSFYSFFIRSFIHSYILIFIHSFILSSVHLQTFWAHDGLAT